MSYISREFHLALSQTGLNSINNTRIPIIYIWTILQQFCHGGDTFIDWKVQGLTPGKLIFTLEMNIQVGLATFSPMWHQFKQIKWLTLMSFYYTASRLLVPYMTPLPLDVTILVVYCGASAEQKTFVTLLPYQTKSIKSSLDYSPSHPWCIQLGHKKKT